MTTTPVPSFRLYKMIVAYDGTKFSGMQRQMTNQAMDERRELRRQELSTTTAVSSEEQQQPPRKKKRRRKDAAITVQDCLEDAILLYCSQQLQLQTEKPGNASETNTEPAGAAAVVWTTRDLCLKFAGRTDKGVSARGQVIAVRLPDNNAKEENHNNDSQQLLQKWEEMRRAVNSRLPPTVSVEHVQELPSQQFEPRHDVKQKLYSYTIKYRRALAQPESSVENSSALTGAGLHSIRSALDSPRVWVCPWALQDDQLPALCEKLQGEHNFAAFVHKGDRSTSNTGKRNKQRKRRSNGVVAAGDNDDNGNDQDGDTEREGTGEEVDDDTRHVLCVDRIHVETTIVSDSSATTTSMMQLPPIVQARFEFQAKGFRRTMIRNLVGYCVDVCRGHDAVARLTWDEIWSGTEAVAEQINAAPACGLCLERVMY